MTAEMQDDISRMMSKISELETRNLELSMQLKRRDANQALLDEMKLPAFNEKCVHHFISATGRSSKT